MTTAEKLLLSMLGVAIVGLVWLGYEFDKKNFDYNYQIDLRPTGYIVLDEDGNEFPIAPGELEDFLEFQNI